jgi:hypothetical protein
LALLHYYSNQTNEALRIWTRIYDKELSDSQFPGFSYIIEFIGMLCLHCRLESSTSVFKVLVL